MLPENYFTVPFEMGQVVVHTNGEGRVRYIGYDLDARYEERLSTSRLSSDIKSYFEGNQVSWKLEMDLEGLSEFQLRVYEKVGTIPYGRTSSYGEIAAAGGCPRGARAVGQVMKTNRFPLIVPCHRVVSANMNIGGFSSGLDLKRFLLRLEGVDF